MGQSGHFTAGDGCRLAYALDSDPALPALVLSNSIATALQMWDAQIAELSRSFRVLRYDTRGHGKSDAPDGAYSLDRLGRDVVELLDTLGLDRVHFCGLSLGGMVGQWLGIHVPERIDRLILSNTSAYLGPSPQWDTLIATLLDRRDMAAMADMFLDNWFPPAMIADQPQVVAAFRAMVLATPPRGLAGCFAAVRDMDLRRTIALIEAPTLVIAGEDDTVTAASHGRQIAETIPGTELLVMAGVHMLNVERPTAFIDAVLGFLTSPKPIDR